MNYLGNIAATSLINQSHTLNSDYNNIIDVSLILYSV